MQLVWDYREPHLCGKWAVLSLAKANANHFTRKFCWGSSSALRVWHTHCSNCTRKKKKKKKKKKLGQTFLNICEYIFRITLFYNFFWKCEYSKSSPYCQLNYIFSLKGFFCNMKVQNCLLIFERKLFSCLLIACSIFQIIIFWDHFCFKFLLSKLI